MGHNRLLVFLFLCLFAGCRPGHRTHSSGSIVVKIQSGASRNVSKIEDFLKFSHFVCLETTDDSMIGDVGKLVIRNGKFYILCKKQSAVFVFDKDGKFLSRAGRVGRGPGEYSDISDFDITPDGDIHINDPLQGKIYVYDKTGGFRYAKQLPQKIWSFSILEDGKLACNMANGVGMKNEKPATHNYVCYSKEGNMLHDGIPFSRAFIGQKIFNGNTRSLFYRYADTVFMSSILNDTIYVVSQISGKLTPRFVVDFNTKRPDAKKPQGVQHNYMESVVSGESPSSPYNFYRLNNGIMFFYDYKSRPYITIASLAGEVLYESNVGYDENGIMTHYTPLVDYDNTGYIVQATSSVNIFDGIDYLKSKNKDHSLLSRISDSIDYESNPVLFFYSNNN